jgi:hypothetical protein
MPKIVRWAARVIGLIITIYFIFWYTIFNVGSVLIDSHSQISANMLVPLGFGILVLAAYILSWRNERLGGILFILASIGTAVVEAVSGWSFIIRSIRGWLFLGFPLLIAGVLFLISSSLSRKSP